MKSILLITALFISSIINAHGFYNNNGFYNNGYYNNFFRNFNHQFQQLNRRTQYLTKSGNRFSAKSKRYLDEENNEYVVEITTSNLNKDNLSISIDNNTISIKGESRVEQKSANSSTISSSHFTQSFSIPQDADNNNIIANFEDNILTIRIPRTEQTEPGEQVIEIN
jgi:HSP20 family protein